MNNEFLLRFTDRLREKKWHIEQSTQPIEVSFNEDFKKRFPNLPEEFIFFVSRIESAVSEDEQSWFLCPKDYSNALPNAEFQWNQFEQISLEATAGDDDWASEIKSFWDCHLPIVLSVRSGYSYIAIGVCEDNFGKIFQGTEPEFEEVSLLANSLPEFLESLVSKSDEYPYRDFI